MKISVSTLAFCGDQIGGMKNLPKDIGIEIFYEWGSETYWNQMLPGILEGRTGKFSIHNTFMGADLEMSLTDNEEKLFKHLMECFDMYHKYDAENLVVHMNAPYKVKPTAAEKAERLARVEGRLARFNDICKKEGVNMVVENLAYGVDSGLYHLCNQEDFLGIFAHNPELNCIIDTGHAVLGGIDICAVQETLKDRLQAYHMHDNNGRLDGHQRICTGVIDWNRFFEYARKYTPNATYVMEYNAAKVESFEAYAEDAAKMRAMMQG